MTEFDKANVRLYEKFNSKHIDVDGELCKSFNKSLIKEEFEDRRELKTLAFGKVASGIVYGYDRPTDSECNSETKLKKHVTLPALISAEIMETHFPEKKIIVQLNFADCNSMWLENDEIFNSKDFKRALENKGIRLNFPTRSTGEYIDAFRSYIIYTAKRSEVNSVRGWNLNKKAHWEFEKWEDMADGKTLNKLSSIRIVEAVAMNKPVLVAWKLLSPNTVINIVIDEANKKYFYEAFHEEMISIYGETTSEKELLKSVSKGASITFVEVVSERKNDRLLERIKYIQALPKAVGLICIVSQNIIFDAACFHLSFESDLQDMERVDLSVMIIPEEFFGNVREFACDGKNAGSNILGGAVAAAYYAMFMNLRKTVGDPPHDFVKQYEKLAARIQSEEELVGIDEIVTAEIVAYIQCEKLELGYFRKEVPGDIVKNSCECMFYDEDFIYIGERLFACMIRRVKNLAGINMIKSALKEAGILVCGRIGYVSKCSVRLEDGSPARVDMLKFKRESLISGDNLDVVDIFVSKKVRESL